MKYIQIAIIGSKQPNNNYISDLEDDFFYHFGEKYFPSIRVFSLDEVDNDYLKFTVIVAIYNENSRDLHRFLVDGEYQCIVSTTEGDSLSGISKKIMINFFGIVEKSVCAEWKPASFIFSEEGGFGFDELEPLVTDGEYPGITPSDPKWVRPQRRK